MVVYSMCVFVVNNERNLSFTTPSVETEYYGIRHAFDWNELNWNEMK